MAAINLAADLGASMGLYEIYTARVGEAFTRAHECLTAARIARARQEGCHELRNILWALRANRSAAANWRRRARHTAQLVLTVTLASCARHDVSFTAAIAPSGDTTFTYTISDAVLERLSGATHRTDVSFELTAEAGGTKLTGDIDRELRAMSLCPESWRFTHAYHVASVDGTSGSWIFQGRCVYTTVKG